ncbi:MAG: biotin--[acetyl-CoA-carboxylase] ligase, partial [Armatimonadota bacterium]
GINVNIAGNEFPDELKPTATSLRIVCGKNLDRFEVLAETLSSLEFWWEKWVSNELDPFWEAYNQLDWLKGKKVRAILPDGTTLEGTALGVTGDGELRLLLPDGTERKLIAGDVSVRPAIASK